MTQCFEHFVEECKTLTIFQWISLLFGIVGVLSAFVAFLSYLSTKRLTERVVETFPLLDPQEIFGECVKALTNVRKELMIMAGVPAIGYTGARHIYDTQLRGTMVNAAVRLKKKFRLTILKPEHRESFYGDGGQGRKDIPRLLEENRSLFTSLQNSGPITDRQVDDIPMLHFLLADARDKTRKAIIWVVEHGVTRSGRVKIKTVGFRTTSEEIITTLRSFYLTL